MNRRLARLVGRWLPSLAATAIVIAVAAPASGANASTQAPSSNLEVMLTLDVSASMRPAIDAAKAAADQFVTSMPDQVPIGLATFGDRVTVLTPPTTDRTQLRTMLDGIRLEEDTALYDAVAIAAGQFSPTVPEKVIVLLSDGKDEGSSAPLEYALAALQGVRVEAISLTTQQTDLASLSSLGAVTSADDQAGVAAAFERVSGLLNAVVVALPPTTAVPTSVAPTTVAPTTTVASVPPTTARALDAGTPVTLAADGGMGSMYLVLGGAGVFAGLFLLVLLVFPQPRVSKARLGIDDSRSMSDFSRRTAALFDSALERRGKRTELATNLAVADIAMRPGEFAGMVGAIALVCGFVGLFFGGLFTAVSVALIVCLGARVYLGRRTARRRAAFAEQLPDVLQLVTGALRSGFGLAQALDAVAEEAEEPARSEFSTALTEARLGRELPAAMSALADRMQSEDLAWVVAAIEINHDIGGNLSEVLTAVGETIRERQRMARQVATHTAEGRLSARILTGLPLLMGVWQWWRNPDVFERMFRGGGLVALVIAGLLLVLGTFWIRRIVNSIAA